MDTAAQCEQMSVRRVQLVSDSASPPADTRCQLSFLYLCTHQLNSTWSRHKKSTAYFQMKSSWAFSNKDVVDNL